MLHRDLLSLLTAALQLSQSETDLSQKAYKIWTAWKPWCLKQGWLLQRQSKKIALVLLSHFFCALCQAFLPGSVTGAISLLSLTREHKTSMSHKTSISVQMNKRLQPTYLYILKGGTQLAVWIGGRVLDWYEGSPGLKP